MGARLKNKTLFGQLIWLTLSMGWSASLYAQTASPNCTPKALTHFKSTANSSEMYDDPRTLYKHGQYVSVVDAFIKGETITAENITLLLSSLYRTRQLCDRQYDGQNKQLAPYIELVEMLDTIVELNEIQILTELWFESNTLPFSSTDIVLALSEVFSLAAVKKVNTVLVHTQSGANSIITKAIMETLAKIGVSVVLGDNKAGPIAMDDLIDEHLVDLVITDASPVAQVRHEDRIFKIGTHGEDKWSMSFDSELTKLLLEIQLREQTLVVYDMSNMNGISGIVSAFPDITYVKFDGFTDASAYFSKKVCNRENANCQSSLHGQVSLVIGGTKETVFINNFLRIAQNANSGKEKDARVYVTSMSTWGNVTRVERRDLANAYIYDAKRLGELGVGYDQQARITALVRDIIGIYEFQSVGVDFSVVPFFGFSGDYYLRNGAVERELSFFRFAELK